MKESGNLAVISEWIEKTLSTKVTPRLIFADASFRKYYRCELADKSLIFAHAPPDKEDLQSFIAIATRWKKNGVQTPEIYHYSLKLGFALLEDFGDTHLSLVKADHIEKAYHKALGQMIAIGKIPQTGLPDFIDVIFPNEMTLLPEWSPKIFPELLNTPDLLTTQWQSLVNELSTQLGKLPRTTCHRDFHCRNLMLLQNDEIGVLDFQDACIGPYCYDLVSLIYDAYIDLPDSLKESLIERFATHWPNQNLQQDIYLVALQRLLKVYGIFCRLAKRDNKTSYLNYLPRVANNIVAVSRKMIKSNVNLVEPCLPLFQQLANQASDCN